MADERPPTANQLISREMDHAFAAAIGKHEVGMVTRWVAIVESVDSEGVRGVWPLAGEGTSSWDALGLLTWGIELERAAVHRNYPGAASD